MKIKSDLETIFRSGARPHHVAYFCEADIPVAKRHELQKLCEETYGSTLDIFDGQALAEILAERDTFWIAEQFLSVPADEWPAESTDEQYQELRERWIVRGDTPQNYAEFLDIKQGLRTAAFDESAKPDLSSWLKLMRAFVADDMADRLVQKARYEIGVAELRGRGSLDPARNYVEQFFAGLSTDSAAAELMDGAVLAVYAWGAVGHQQTSIPIDVVEAYLLGSSLFDRSESCWRSLNRRRCNLSSRRPPPAERSWLISPRLRQRNLSGDRPLGQVTRGRKQRNFFGIDMKLANSVLHLRCRGYFRTIGVGI
ncbi:MAG: hypothetical protein ACLP1D_01195 [Xanthobacteraceae bacterium]